MSITSPKKHSVTLCVPVSEHNGNIHHSVEELKKAPSTVQRRLLEYVAAWPQRRDQPEHPRQALTGLIAEDMRVRAKQHPLSRRKPHPHIVVLINEETLQLRRRRGWADTGGHPRTRVRAHLRTFFTGEKSAKNPFTSVFTRTEEDAEETPPSTRESTICSTVRSELRS